MSELQLPIKGQSHAILSAEERTRIQAAEEYRLEVRRHLEARPENEAPEADRFWKEKLFVPLVIAMLTLLLSEWAVPRAARLMDRGRRQAETAGSLLQEVAQSVTEIAAAADARADAIDEFWVESAGINAIVGEFALKRDLREMTTKEFERQDGLIENDRKRVNERRDKSVDEYAKQVAAFRTWLSRTRLRIETEYMAGAQRDAADQALASFQGEVKRIEGWLDSRDSAYQKREFGSIAQAKSMRANFRKHELSPQQYRAQMNVILQELRTTKPIEPAGAALNEARVATVLRFVRSGEQVP
jgi:hypothetical protein